MCLLWPNHMGAMFQELKPCCMRSQSHGRLWPLLKLKLGNCWLTSKCGSSCKKINSGFQFQFQSLSFQFNFQFHQFQFQFQFQNWIDSKTFLNWIDPNPATCPHNTPHKWSCYNNEQTTKQTKALNNSYIYIYIYIYIHISCKCDTNCAGHFTLDAHASRPVACLLYFITIRNLRLQPM